MTYSTRNKDVVRDSAQNDDTVFCRNDITYIYTFYKKWRCHTYSAKFADVMITHTKS